MQQAFFACCFSLFLFCVCIGYKPRSTDVASTPVSDVSKLSPNEVGVILPQHVGLLFAGRLCSRPEQNPHDGAASQCCLAQGFNARFGPESVQP